jgi:hypothetical protein
MWFEQQDSVPLHNNAILMLRPTSTNLRFIVFGIVRLFTHTHTHTHTDIYIHKEIKKEWYNFVCLLRNKQWV